jgi:hypothetical protein
VKKKVKKQPKDVKATTNLPVKEVVIEKEVQSDFGGLPKRDLKKNLGCG